MKNRDMDKELDNKLDALLCTRPISAGPDFARRTLERLHAMPEVDDALVEACLARSQSRRARVSRPAPSALPQSGTQTSTCARFWRLRHRL
jgi:hypothetical protein